MLDRPTADAPTPETRDWAGVSLLTGRPDTARSLLEIVVTALPFVAFWVLAYLSLSVHWLLTAVFVVCASFFLVRLFMIQHDCGHHSFFVRHQTNDWVGRVIGVLTLTPYQVWRHSHAKRSITRRRAPRPARLRRHRHADRARIPRDEPLAASRLPDLPLPAGDLRHRPGLHLYAEAAAALRLHALRRQVLAQRMGTNLSIAIVAGLMMWLIGWKAFLMVHLPICLLTGSIGVWLFYVQHQFEDSYWRSTRTGARRRPPSTAPPTTTWPQPFRWLTANIGVHHVHHLYARIPYYKLQQVLKDFPELANIRRFGFHREPEMHPAPLLGRAGRSAW